MSKTSRTSITMPSTAKKIPLLRFVRLHSTIWSQVFVIPRAANEFLEKLFAPLRAHYNSVEVFKADFYSGIGANPLIIFTTIAVESGILEFKWVGDDGYEAVNQACITVS